MASGKKSPHPKKISTVFTYEADDMADDWDQAAVDSSEEGSAVKNIGLDLSPQKSGSAMKRSPGILRVEGVAPRRSSGSSVDFRFDHMPVAQGDSVSPQPSMDRDAGSIFAQSSSQDNLIDSPVRANFLDVEDIDDDEYSISASAILQRRRHGRRRSLRRRPSSPFPGDMNESFVRRRASRGLSVITISSAETAIHVDDAFNEEQLSQHVALHKEVIQNMRHQPWDMGRKLRVLRRAKVYVKQHEGALQQRLAESRTFKDVLAKGQLLITKFLLVAKRELINFASFLVPWDARIKEIESLFGSAVASYFTFLRWVFWINLVITVIFSAFVMIPEVLTTTWEDDEGERKGLLAQEKKTATDLQTLWDFEGILKYSPIFYGFYTNLYENKQGYKLPFAYFLTGMTLYIYSFVALLRKMAKNSRMSKLSDKDDECTFTWKLFTGWDFTIGHPETAANRMSAVTVGFKEALLEEKEKEREQEKISRKIIIRRIAANFIVLALLASSAYAVVLVVQRSTEPEAESSWWRQNEITVVMSLISLIFPNFFELVGLLEKYHPRRQLRWQLARIMVLNLLNLYTLILALFGKVNVMTNRLSEMKQNISYYHSLDISTSPMPFNFSDPSSLTPDNFTELYFNYTQVTTAILNATERYSGYDTTEPVNNTYCYEVLVDCATLSSTPSSIDLTSTESDNSTTLAAEYVYDDEYYLDEFNRSKRQLDDNPVNPTESPPKTTPRNLARIFDTLNSILRNLRNGTTRASSTVRVPTTVAGLTEFTDGIYEDITTTPEWQALTSQEGSEVSSEQPTSEQPASQLCYITVCQKIDNNDTQPATDSTTLPCRGDNPEGCTDFWTSVRDTQPTQWYHPTEALELTTVRTTLSPDTRLELRKLCWETMFGQELVKLTVMDLVLTVASILIIDFIRAVFVRVFNACWCWDLEKYFPQYGEFKIAENILHLVNNQGMIWMGMFFSPGLPAINLFKLVILLYVRSWAVLTCNVPHEVIFRASRSNNFYLWLLLSMLFLCTLPVAYAIVWLEPSWHCGPFSEYRRMFHVLTEGIYSWTPSSLHWVLTYIASPGIVIPLLVLLILVIYYLLSLSTSLREAVTDLRTQLRRERDAERQKHRENAEGQNNAAPPPMTETQGKATPQWRKAAVPAPLAREAAEKRINDKMVGKLKAAPLPVSPRSNDVAQIDGDGSDLDISESLPNDSIAKSPVLVGKAVLKQSAQPVYAVVKKKKTESKETKPAEQEAAKKKTAEKEAASSKKKKAESAKMVQKPARTKQTAAAVAAAAATADIPLIKISKTESIEKDDQEPRESKANEEPVVDDEFREVPSDNSSGSQTRRGALNLILERAKQRMAAKGIIEKESKNLVCNMEETAAETPMKSTKPADKDQMETKEQEQEVVTEDPPGEA